MLLERARFHTPMVGNDQHNEPAIHWHNHRRHVSIPFANLGLTPYQIEWVEAALSPHCEAEEALRRAAQDEPLGNGARAFIAAYEAVTSTNDDLSSVHSQIVIPHPPSYMIKLAYKMFSNAAD